MKQRWCNWNISTISMNITSHLSKCYTCLDFLIKQHCSTWRARVTNNTLQVTCFKQSTFLYDNYPAHCRRAAVALIEFWACNYVCAGCYPAMPSIARNLWSYVYVYCHFNLTPKSLSMIKEITPTCALPQYMRLTFKVITNVGLTYRSVAHLMIIFSFPVTLPLNQVVCRNENIKIELPLSTVASTKSANIHHAMGYIVLSTLKYTWVSGELRVLCCVGFYCVV